MSRRTGVVRHVVSPSADRLRLVLQAGLEYKSPAENAKTATMTPDDVYAYVQAVMENARVPPEQKPLGYKDVFQTQLTKFFGSLFFTQPALRTNKELLLRLVSLSHYVLRSFWDIYLKNDPEVLLQAMDAAQPFFWRGLEFSEFSDPQVVNGSTIHNLGGSYDNIEGSLEAAFAATEMRKKLTKKVVLEMATKSLAFKNLDALADDPDTTVSFSSVCGANVIADADVYPILTACSYGLYVSAAHAMWAFLYDAGVTNKDNVKEADREYYDKAVRFYSDPERIVDYAILATKRAAKFARPLAVQYKWQIWLIGTIPPEMLKGNSMFATRLVAIYGRNVQYMIHSRYPTWPTAFSNQRRTWGGSDYTFDGGDISYGASRFAVLSVAPWALDPAIIFMCHVWDKWTEGYLPESQKCLEFITAEQSEINAAIVDVTAIESVLSTVNSTFMKYATFAKDWPFFMYDNDESTGAGNGYLLKYAGLKAQRTLRLRLVAAQSWAPWAELVLKDMLYDLTKTSEWMFNTVRKAQTILFGRELFGDATIRNRVDLLKSYSDAASTLVRRWPTLPTRMTEWEREQRKKVQEVADLVLKITEDPNNLLFKYNYKREFEEEFEEARSNAKRAQTVYEKRMQQGIGATVTALLDQHVHWDGGEVETDEERNVASWFVSGQRG